MAGSRRLERLTSARHGGIVAIHVPAETSEARNQDEKAKRELELLMKVGSLRRVLTTAAVERHDGLAIIAILDREESVEILFHYVGPPYGEMRGGWADMDAFQAVNESLAPPELADAAGASYTPVRDRPIRASGTGGRPDPARPRVVTGTWRYQPVAPADPTTFFATWHGRTWKIAAP